MRARVAYISSLGTTAILVAAALLMLAVVSAIVAFRGWPGAANADGVQSVPLTPGFTRASASLVVTHVHRANGVVRSGTRTVAARTPTRRLSTAGLVKVVGSPSLPGVVKVTSGPGPGMHSVFPQPQAPGVGSLPSFPPPSGRNPAVTVPLPTASSGDGSGPPLQLPDGGATAPVTQQVDSVVSNVVSEAPSPPPVVEGVRSVLPIH
jgi:hypothetical protein